MSARWEARVYGGALALLPAELRRRYGAEMASLFEDRLEERAGSPGRRVILLAGALVDVVLESVSGRLASVSGAALADDLRAAWRSLRRRPGFAAVCIGTLAAGLAATTSTYAVADATLLDPVPYPEPERLFSLTTPALTTSSFGEWRAAVAPLATLSGYTLESPNARTGQGTVRLRVMPVAEGFFDLLGVRPVAGRSFTEEEWAARDRGVVLLRSGFAATHFGSVAAALGAVLRLEEEAVTVVGVLPQDFVFARYGTIEAWRPLPPGTDVRISGLGRLAPGTSVEAAADVFGALAAQADPAAEPDGVRLHMLLDWIVGDVRGTLWTLLGASLCVLLAAGANVAGLLVGLMIDRTPEMAVRGAMGASRSRVVRQVALEGLLIGAAAVTLAVWLGGYATQALLALAPGFLAAVHVVEVDVRIVATVSMSALLVLLFATAGPATLATRALSPVARSGGGRSTASGRVKRLRGALVVAQVAASVLLLAGAWLALATWATLRPSDPGFTVADRYAAALDLPEAQYQDPEARRRFARTLQEEVRRRGVGVAHLVNELPLSGSVWVTALAAVDGEAPTRPTNIHLWTATPGYQEWMSIRLVAGRAIGPGDHGSAPAVAVVSESAAARLWPDEATPIGRSITFSAGAEPRSWDVVGVMADTRIFGSDTRGRSVVLVAHEQAPLGSFHLVTHGAERLSEVVAQAVGSVDDRVALPSVRSLEDVIGADFVVPRFQLALIGTLAGVALLLCVIGCYALLARQVASRVHEIALRVALGARSDRLVLGVWLSALRVLVSGALLGGVAFVALRRTLEARVFLHGVEASDPRVVAAAVALVAAAMALAAVGPGVRASRVAPMAVLKGE